MDEENASSTNSIKLELRVHMHCDACERSVRRTIQKIGGVEKVEVDREENKVTVTGDFEPEKVVKRIKQKTGKKAEILVPEEEEDHEEDGADAAHGQFQRHSMIRCYGYVPYCYVLVHVAPPDIGGAAVVAHDFQRHGVISRYAHVPYYYGLVPVHPDSGGGGGADVGHEFQRSALWEWDRCLDDENTEACRVM